MLTGRFARNRASTGSGHNGATDGSRSFVGLVSETEVGVAVLSNCSRSVDVIGFRILEAIHRPAGFFGAAREA
jgi:hypothetical protein